MSKQEKWLTISNNEKRSEINLKLTMAKRTACLATDGAKSEIVQQRPRADLTKERRGGGFACCCPDSSWLRPLVQKEHIGTVYDISVHPFYVNQMLHFLHPYHLVVRRSPNLHPITGKERKPRKFKMTKPRKLKMSLIKWIIESCTF